MTVLGSAIRVKPPGEPHDSLIGIDKGRVVSNQRGRAGLGVLRHPRILRVRRASQVHPQPGKAHSDTSTGKSLVVIQMELRKGNNQMMHRSIRFGLIAVLSASLGGIAAAQPEDPCAGGDEMGDPCGGDDMGGGDEGGGDMGGGDEGGGDEGGGDAGGDAAAAAPAEGGGGGAHGLTLPKGKIAIWAALGVGMSTDFVGDPISLSPDVWYGVSDDLSVGLVHSSMGTVGFWGTAGGSLCLAGDLCGDVFSNTGVHAKYQFQKGDLQLAGIGGLNTMTTDPLTLGLQAGVLGRWSSGKIMVDFAPTIRIGLTERDFNKEVIYVPVTVGYAVNDKIHAGLQTGILGPLDGFGDAFNVPVGVGAMYMVSEQIMAGGSFTFHNLLGKNSSADSRSLDLVVGYMM